MTQILVPTPALPRGIGRLLGRLDRRIRGAAVLRGLGIVAIVTSVGALVGMAADFAWVLPQAGRWALWGGWVAGCAAVTGWCVVRPMLRRANPIDLAAVLERSNPEVGERLTGTVGLLGERADAHGSAALIAALAEDAEAAAEGVDASKGVSLRGPVRWLVAAVGVMAVVGTPAVVRPDPFGNLARRFLSPWADIDRVGRFVVTVEPGDRVAAIGADLAVSAHVRPRFGTAAAPEEAWLEWTDANDVRHRVAMAAESAEASAQSRSFAVTLPSLTESFSYRVVSGPATSRKFQVKAMEPPAVAKLEARVEPPSYTKLPPALAADPARIEAWEGSSISLTVSTNRAVQGVEVEWPKAEKPVVAELASDRQHATVKLPAEASGAYSVAVRDEYGMTNRPESPRHLVVRPDAPPVLAVRGADDLKESRPEDTLRVDVAAKDDIAVDSVELHYAIRRGGTVEGDGAATEEGHVATQVKGLGTRTARGPAELPFGPLKLRAGDTISYRVRVADNRPAPKGPNVVWSSPMSLEIVAKAETMMARQDRATREAIQEKLNALKKAAAENRHEAEQLRYAADAAQRGNGEWDKEKRQALDERETQARGVADRLQLLARELADDARFQQLARPAKQIAEVEAESGRAMLDHARHEDDPTRRLSDLRQADARLAAVSNRLEDLQRRFDELARREDDLRRLHELADREESLASRAGEEAGDRARRDRLQADQNSVRNELDALLKESPALRADVLAAQADEAEKLARRAHELAERQRDEARKATDPARRADALKALAEAQRELEDDARRLALDVDQPLAENGRGHVNVEQIRQAAEPLAQGDIEQARHRLEAAENELRRLVRDLEDVPGDPRALAFRLARRQETLVQQVSEAIRESGANRGDRKPEAEAELAKRLKPLIDRQKAIAKMAAEIQPTGDPQSEGAKQFPTEVAKEAVRRTERAAETLNEGKPREMEAAQHEARNSLHRLAASLPDAYRRSDPTRRQLQQARQQSEEVAREVERHLRETAPHPGRPYDAAKAGEKLAAQTAPLAERQERIAKALETLEVSPRSEPQRERAAKRAKALAEALKAAADKGATADQRAESRETLPAVQAEARAAMERLDQKFNKYGRPPADDVADELVADQRTIEKATEKTPEARAAKAAEQRRVATALRSLTVPDAPIAQGEAVRAAERAAKALAEDSKDSAEAMKEAMEAAQALADQLGDRQSPKSRAATLARAERALNEAGDHVEATDAARRQREIATDLRRLPAPAEKKGDAEAKVRRAAELADRARDGDRDHPASGRPTPAALTQARGEASEALEQLAAGAPAEAPAAAEAATAKAPRTAPADPELEIGPKQAEAAAELAQRERRLREQLQAILGERVEPQQALRRESAMLAKSLNELQDRTRAMSDRAQGPAREAAQHLGEHAPRTMEQAADQLAQGQAAAARESQRRAAELVERGAQQAEDLAAALRTDRGMQAPPSSTPPGPLSAARESMRQAARQLDQAREPDRGAQAAQAAQQAMNQAARALQEAVQHAAQAQQQAKGAEPNNNLAQQPEPANGPSAGPAADPKGAPASQGTPDLEALKDLVRSKTGRAWGELPGHLRTEILEMSRGRYRDDYARLIQLYFREIAADADGGNRP